MYGFGALEVAKYSRVQVPQSTDSPDDSILTGDQVGSTTGGYAVRRQSVYGGVTPRFLPRDAQVFVTDAPVPSVPTVPTPTPAAPVVIVSSGVLPPAAIPPVEDASGLPWWVWLGGLGAGAYFLTRGKR